MKCWTLKGWMKLVRTSQLKAILLKHLNWLSSILPARTQPRHGTARKMDQLLQWNNVTSLRHSQHSYLVCNFRTIHHVLPDSIKINNSKQRPTITHTWEPQGVCRTGMFASISDSRTRRTCPIWRARESLVHLKIARKGMKDETAEISSMYGGAEDGFNENGEHEDEMEKWKKNR